MVMNKIDRLQNAISERQAELHRVADTLARSAHSLRRRGAILRVLLIVLGALTAAQATVDQLRLPRSRAFCSFFLASQSQRLPVSKPPSDSKAAVPS